MKILIHHISGETAECFACDFLDARAETATICSEKGWKPEDCKCDIDGVPYELLKKKSKGFREYLQRNKGSK